MAMIDRLTDRRPWPPLAAKRLQRTTRRRWWTAGLGVTAVLLLLALNQSVLQPVLTQVRDQGLWLAVSSGGATTTRFWLARGGNPNRQIGGAHFRPLLYHAVRSGNPEVVKLLLKAGAAPDLPGCESATTALEAAREDAEVTKDRRCLDLLLQPGHRSYAEELKRAGNQQALPWDLREPPLSVTLEP